MKIAMGKKLWLHKIGEPAEVVISSHGCRDGDDLQTFSLRNYLPGTTVKFVVPDGTPSGILLRQSVDGGFTWFSTHSYEGNDVLWDYYLNKFQGERHGSPQETYASILDAMNSNKNKRENPQIRAWTQQQNEKKIAEGGASLSGLVDFVDRGVITIRSGGRNKKQAVLLSEVIREAQTPPFQFTTFICNFCRVVV